MAHLTAYWTRREMRSVHCSGVGSKKETKMEHRKVPPMSKERNWEKTKAADSYWETPKGHPTEPGSNLATHSVKAMG